MARVKRFQIACLSALIFAIGSVASVIPRSPASNLPEGVSYDPSTNLLCSPTSWTDIASFFLGNFFSHAATVVVYPGEPVWIVVFNMLLAVLFPSLGLGRGILAIRRASVFYKDPVRQATRSRAMCMVVRARDWRPLPGQVVRSLAFVKEERAKDNIHDEGYNGYHHIKKDKKKLDELVKEMKEHKEPIDFRVQSPPWLLQDADDERIEIVEKGYQVFGNYKLPAGYELGYVPENAVVTAVSTQNHPELTGEQSKYLLTSNYSFSSGLIAVIQIVYASVTLYRSQGSQVQEYGYAAFGFTVLPYLFMSFVNLVGNMVTPRYSTIYMVHSEIMDEALQRGGFFEGVVGSVEAAPLPVDEIFVFSASFDQSARTFDSRKTSKIYMHGEIEPIEESEALPSDASVAVEHPMTEDLGNGPAQEKEKSAMQSTAVETKGEFGEGPLILCPSCNYFKVAEQNRPFFQPSLNKLHGSRTRAAIGILRLFIGGLPLIVIGAMSHFKAESSTVAQRGWILSWLVVGMSIIGNPYFGNYVIRILAQLDKDRRRYWRSGKKYTLVEHLANVVCVLLLSSAMATSAIGGFVVVAQMLRSYGSCSLLD